MHFYPIFTYRVFKSKITEALSEAVIRGKNDLARGMGS